MQQSAVSPSPRVRLPANSYGIVRSVLGLVLILFMAWRLYSMLTTGTFGVDTWARWATSGLTLGAMYAVVALGYTLVYGVLFMINFAHGEIMMIGAFTGYLVFEVFNGIVVNPATELTVLNAFPIVSVILAFLIGMTVSMISAFFLERIAYRPLRGAPRLVPLISAIGASIFLQNAAQLMFGPKRRYYENPGVLPHFQGWPVTIGGDSVVISYTGTLSVIVSIILMIGLYILVQRTRLGRAMRAVAEDKKTAALMGIDVDGVISRTFMISGALAGAAGVMWGLHFKVIVHVLGFVPGIKAFTAAVLGGIGNIPGAMVGGIFLGMVEALGPGLLGIDQQLQDVIAFSMLVLVLIFRPSGILGQVLNEEKV